MRGQSVSGAPLCCTGYSGCYEPLVDGDPITTGIIRCDAHEACWAVEIEFSATKNVYASGARSVEYADIIFGHNDYNVDCGGANSCENIISISNASNLFCNGYFSCTQIGSINSITNVWFYGALGRIWGNVANNTIENITGSVYCGGTSACSYNEISNIGVNVKVVGYLTGEFIIVENVGNCVVGFGLQSLQNAVIKNVKNVYCDGVKTCMSSTIVGVSNVKSIAHSNNRRVFDGARIVSQAEQFGNNFEIKLKGTSDGYVNPTEIYCNETDTCVIECLSKAICSSVDLYCFGICYVDCDSDNNIACPTVVSGTVFCEWTDTIATTSSGISTSNTVSTDDTSSENSETSAKILTSEWKFFSRVVLVSVVLCPIYCSCFVRYDTF